MNRNVFLFGFVALSILLMGLFLSNEPKDARYRQRAMPLYSLVLSVAACVLLQYYPTELKEAFAFVIDTVHKISNYDLSYLNSYFYYVFNLFIVTILLTIKTTARTTRLIFSFFSFLFSLLRKRTQIKYPKPSNLLPAYGYFLDRGVSIRDNWVYPGRYFRIMAWISFLMTVVYLGFTASDSDFLTNYDFFNLPVIPLLIFLESAWYLGGARKLSREERIQITDIQSSEKGSFEALWYHYAEICPSRLIAGSPRVPYQLKHNGMPGQNSGQITESTDTTHQELSVIERTLVKTQHKNLTILQKEALLKGLQKKDILLIEPTCRQGIPVVFALLQHELLSGRNILIIIPSASNHNDKRTIEKWLEQEMATIYFTKMQPQISWNLAVPKNITCITPATLLDHTADINPTWLNSLSRVVILDTDSFFFTDWSQAKECCDLFADTCPHPPAYILLATHDRATNESSFRDFLGVEPYEFLFHRHSQARHAYHVWQAEGIPSFQEDILPVDQSRYLGHEIPLSIPAFRDGVGKINGLGMEKAYWHETQEEMNKTIVDFLPRNALHWFHFPMLHTPAKRSVVIARDSHHNLIHTIKTGLDFNIQETLLLCVAPAYLLRDYLADNIQFFLDTNSLSSFLLSPRPLVNRTTTAVYLFNRMKNSFVPEDMVDYHLTSVGFDCETDGIQKCLTDLFQEAFDIHVVNDALLQVRESDTLDTQKKKFFKTRRFSLANTATDFVDFAPYQYYRIIDPSGNLLELVHSDILFQQYLPFQMHGWNGECYRIVNIDTSEKIIRLQSTTTNNSSIKKIFPVITVTLPGSQSKTRLDGGKPRFINSIGLRREIWESDIVITTTGYHMFRNGWANHEYTSLEEGPWTRRHHRAGRIFVLEILPPPDFISDFSMVQIENTFALLLQELMVTVFPESHKSLIVTTPHLEDNDELRSASWATKRNPLNLMPRLDAEGAFSSITIFFIEDAFFDKGIIGSLVGLDHLKLVFELLEDYLCWLVDTETEALASEYILSGNNDSRELFLFEPLRDLLEKLLSTQGQERLRGQRRGARRPIQKEITGRICDFCSEIMSDSSFERLQDGRERCRTCSREAVTNPRELKKIYREARAELQSSYGIRLRKSIDIKFTDAKTMAETQHTVFIPTTGFDARAAGFARKNGENYSICIENGQPYHMVLATVVHELTHIWQFDMLNMKKLEQDHGKVWIEGHAMWAEIACLQKRGIGLNYCNHEKERNDVYGIGFREIDEQVNANVDNNPFRLLYTEYPMG